MAKNSATKNTIIRVKNKFWLSNALSLSKDSVNPETNALSLNRARVIMHWNTNRGVISQGKVLQMVKQKHDSTLRAFEMFTGHKYWSKGSMNSWKKKGGKK